MREAEDVNPPDLDVPGMLRGLKPATPPANVARSIWYQSGYQAGRRRLNLWRGATISLALGITALLSVRQISNRATPVDHITVVKAPPVPMIQSPIAVPSPASATYARLLNSLMQDGSRPWAEETLPAGNPHTPPASQSSRYPMELNLPPLN